MEVAKIVCTVFNVWLIRTLISLHRLNPVDAFGHGQQGSHSLPSSGEG